MYLFNKEGQILHKCDLGQTVSSNISFSPDGKLVAAGRLYDVESGEMLGAMKTRQVRFAKDGTLLLLLSDGVYRVDPRTGEQSSYFKPTTPDITYGRFVVTPDEKYFIGVPFAQAETRFAAVCAA